MASEQVILSRTPSPSQVRFDLGRVFETSPVFHRACLSTVRTPRGGSGVRRDGRARPLRPTGRPERAKVGRSGGPRSRASGTLGGSGETEPSDQFVAGVARVFLRERAVRRRPDSSYPREATLSSAPSPTAPSRASISDLLSLVAVLPFPDFPMALLLLPVANSPQAMVAWSSLPRIGAPSTCTVAAALRSLVAASISPPAMAADPRSSSHHGRLKLIKIWCCLPLYAPREDLCRPYELGRERRWSSCAGRRWEEHLCRVVVVRYRHVFTPLVTRSSPSANSTWRRATHSDAEVRFEARFGTKVRSEESRRRFLTRGGTTTSRCYRWEMTAQNWATSYGIASGGGETSPELEHDALAEVASLPSPRPHPLPMPLHAFVQHLSIAAWNHPVRSRGSCGADLAFDEAPLLQLASAQFITASTTSYSCRTFPAASSLPVIPLLPPNLDVSPPLAASGAEWVPLTSRTLVGIFSLIGSSPSVRN
nr:unnamed protein product [Digitaria exilis]